MAESIHWLPLLLLLRNSLLAMCVYCANLAGVRGVLDRGTAQEAGHVCGQKCFDLAWKGQGCLWTP